jgi:energy-converting hydrogenase Eha subunit G
LDIKFNRNNTNATITEDIVECVFIIWLVY